MRQSVLAIKDLANRAGQGISMDPERMGASLLQECESGLNSFLAQIVRQNAQHRGGYRTRTKSR